MFQSKKIIKLIKIKNYFFKITNFLSLYEIIMIIGNLYKILTNFREIYRSYNKLWKIYANFRVV